MNDITARAHRVLLPISRELVDEARKLDPLVAATLRGENRRPDPPTIFGCDRPPDLWLRLMAARPDKVALAVLDLHRPVATYPWHHWVDGRPFEPRAWHCVGCDFEGYEAESPDWPCRTAELVAELAGVSSTLD